MAELLDYFQDAPVFSKFEVSDHVELIYSVHYKQYQKGDFICWQDELLPYVAYIAKGRAEWGMLSPERKSQLVFRLGPCDVIWGDTLFNGKPMPASLEEMDALENARKD